MNSPRRGSDERRGGGAARAGSGKTPQLFTLGAVRLVRQGVDETSQLGPKHLALLVYLLHEQRPMHPSEVSDLLGRGQDPGKEKEGLTRAVTWLRENVPGVSIRLTGDTIEAFGGVTLDTREIDTAIDGGDPSHVAELYVGEFLEGFESGSPAFDEWAQKERGRLKRAWSHAMLTAAQEAERRRRWETAAEWWRVLVARAPMRREAVAGLLGALAESGQTKDAARAYADYTERLKESGIAQPADQVKEVISKHKVLRDIEAGRIKPPPAPPGAAKPARPAPTPPPEPVEPEPSEPPIDLEYPVPSEREPPPLQTPLPAAPPVSPEPPAPKPDDPSVAGFEAGASPLTREGAAAEAKGEPAQEEAWDEIVDITSTDRFEVDITPAPSVTPPPQKPADLEDGFEAPLEDVVAQEPEAWASRKPVSKLDDGLKHARAAAHAFKGIEGTEHDRKYGGTGHKVTSVRREWGPVLRETWEELEPWRAKLKEWLVAALHALAAVFVLGLQLAGRGLNAVGLKAGASVAAVGGRMKTARQRAAETRAKRAQVRGERKTQKLAEREARNEAKRTEKEAKEAEKQAKKEAEKEAAKAVLEAPPEPEAAEVAPWDEEALEPPPVPKPAKAAPVEVELPDEEFAPAAEYAAPAAEVPLIDVTPPRVKRKRRPILPVLLRFWYAPVALAVIGLGVVFGPRLVGKVGGIIGGITEELPTRLPEVQAPTIPTVSLPRVTIRTPSFVETSVSRIAEMFSGPLLEESGQWLLLADVEIEGLDGASAARTADGATAAALGQVLEADLIQARFFYVVPRERALIALRRTAGSASETLPLPDALTLAGAAGFTGIISARVTRHEVVDSASQAVVDSAGQAVVDSAGQAVVDSAGQAVADSVPFEVVDSVRLQVFNAVGDTLYGVAAEIAEESSTLETLVGLIRAVRDRLGEPDEEIEASLPPTQVLSTSTAALDAYAQARLHFYAGRYSQVIAAARMAVRRDTTFALAYRLLAETYALTGQRTLARATLEAAWHFAERLTERERLRILADRHTWDGRLEEAVLTYDDLFSKNRDDVGALKGQALVQRMIGVRGRGEGNLRVAYTIDPYDWPRLSRIARYLGYRGRLPDVDSLVAALQEEPQ
jgi:DNA-binding SARP family transcriptional activator/tetratricopeptide (TPR) repeat protein